MPIELKINSINLKYGDTYVPIDLFEDNSYSSQVGWTSPEFYGAVGDGTADDTAAWQSAVDSGKNVQALGKVYKCGTIEVTKNISIDCNGADFNCSSAKLFDIKGSVTTTLTGQSNYSANQVGYQITNQAYSNYTGFAMLQGTNNFDESRTTYLGGFVCTFHNGVLDGSYPIDVKNGTDNLTVLLISPITVRLTNVGNVIHLNSGTNYAIQISYGFGCVVENINAKPTTSYIFVDLYNCLKCICQNIRITGELGSTGTNSYMVAMSNSSYCVVRDSYIYNKHWHCVTTGNRYLCYRNLIDNCVLMSYDAYAYCDHENGVGTIVQNSTVEGIVPGFKSVVNNVLVISRNNSSKDAILLIRAPTDKKLSGATVTNLTFLPNDASNCLIYLDSYPNENGKTFYYDNIKIENVRVISETVTGKFVFGFGSSATNNKNFVVGSLMFNDCDITIDLSNSNPYADLSNMVAKKATYEVVT